MVGYRRIRGLFIAGGLAAGVVGLIAGYPGVVAAATTTGNSPPALKTYLSALTPQQIQSLSADANQKMIVLLRNQHPEAPGATTVRRSRLASDESPITHEL